MSKISVYSNLFLYSLPPILGLNPELGILERPKGCHATKCGDIDIPYPFGIGPNFSYNHFFDITCNASTPFLTNVMHDLQVVDLTSGFYQNVMFVSYPFVELCGNTSSIPLTNITSFGDSPFIFHVDQGNNLVVNGCNAGASIVARNGTILKGCDTLCGEDDDGEDSYCQTPISDLGSSMESYEIRLHRVSRNRGGCVQVGLGRDGMIDGSTGLPLIAALQWKGKDLNKSKNSNCSSVEDGMEICKCMNGFHGNPYLPNGCQGLNPELGILERPKGCHATKCGDIDIPYPFGIGPNFSYNHFFDITCNASTPFLTNVMHDLQVVDLTSGFYQNVMFVSYPFVELCGNTSSIPLTNITSFGDSPFIFHVDQGNNLVVNGCNAGASIVARNGTILKGCDTLCGEDDDGEDSYCQTPISDLGSSMESYEIRLHRVSRNRGGCVQVGLGRDGMIDGSTGLPLIAALQWKGKDLNKSKNSNCSSVEDGMEICKCMNGFHGNPYLPNGCQVPEECKNCGGQCGIDYEMYNSSWDEDPNLVQFLCHTFEPVNRSPALITGLCASIRSVMLLLGGFLLYRMVKKMKEKRRRANNFKQNGGLLLQQQLASYKDGVMDKSVIFTVEELEKATDSFNKNRILGHGGQGTVYKGMLVDGRIVAIKKAKKVDGKQSQHFINEVVILSNINHRNVVKLLGCCLETKVPLLVYEYVPNGMLSQHIHEPREDFHITWKMRLQIAVEIAGALAYLHSSSSTPIYPRDIKSSNILLDEKYRAKIADFGISRSVSIDQTHLTTNVVGTFGYLDPEYFRSNQFTEKSDVYSFGVVLVELITGKQPILTIECYDHKSLASQFLECMESSTLVHILDPYISKENIEEVMGVANHATRCLSMVGIDRPSMKEVAITIEGIRSQQPWSLRRMCQEIEDGSNEASMPEIYKDLSPSSFSTSSFFDV